MSPIHVVLAILVTFLWGVNFSFITWALESFPPLVLSSLRFFFTAIPLILFIKPPKFNRTLIIYAVGTFVMQYAFLFTAMHLGASAGLSSLLLQSQIFITVLFAYLMLGEPVSKMQIVGMLVGVSGLIVIATNLGGDMPLLSFICILIAAIGWSLGNIASKKVERRDSQTNQTISTIHKYSAIHHALSLVVWGGLIACVILTLLTLIIERDAWQLTTFTHSSIKSWLSLIFIVYMSTLVGFGLWAYLLSKNSAARVLPFALLIPIFGMTTSVLLTGEAITWWKILAMLLILSGLILANMKRKY